MRPGSPAGSGAHARLRVLIRAPFPNGGLQKHYWVGGPDATNCNGCKLVQVDR
jgi:hypothetical protein